MNDTNKEVKNNFKSYMTKVLTKLAAKLFLIISIIVVLIAVILPVVLIINLTVLLVDYFNFLAKYAPFSTIEELCFWLTVSLAFGLFWFQFTGDFSKRNNNKVLGLTNHRENKN
ncbi:TPA: hypothetical protein I7229_21010 [Vibrio vulnificus]|nr:hypothetical protein [Vibrio vulnificus]HDY7571845.1 hypothetical protein [Vibrio vulnificus]